MKSGKRPVLFVFSIIILFVIVYLSSKVPMQNLKITARTTAEEFDISGATDLYCLKSQSAGESHTAVIKFMAVKNTSDSLFTSHGTGQYVYLGCSEMTAERSFISLGTFLHVKLSLEAAQTDLKLEDGTPFDITRYSLKPMITVK